MGGALVYTSEGDTCSGGCCNTGCTTSFGRVPGMYCRNCLLLVENSTGSYLCCNVNYTLTGDRFDIVIMMLSIRTKIEITVVHAYKGYS